jgi:hypothetical protein
LLRLLAAAISLAQFPASDALSTKHESTIRPNVSANDVSADIDIDAVAVAASADDDAASERKTFVSLLAECHRRDNASFVLNLQTSEPFHGWIYARDRQVSQLIRPGLPDGIVSFQKSRFG